MPTKPKADAPKPKPAEPAKARPSEPKLDVLAAAAKTKPDAPKNRPSEPKLDALAAAAKAKPLDQPKRPSEPKLDVLAAAAKAKPLDQPKRPSEPKLDVLAVAAKGKLDPLKASLPQSIVVAPAKARPAEPLKPRPSDPKLAEAAKGKLPEWKALIGKPLTCSWRRTSGHPIEVIDWARFPDRMTWLDDVFGDCDVSKHFVGLISDKHGQFEWVSGSMLPVALLGQQHPGEGQLEAILLIDTAMGDSPIFAIEVDGTAIPAKKPQQVAANLAALKIEVVKPEAKAKAARAGADFDTKRSLVVSGKMTGDARKVMTALTGDKDSGASYLDPQVTKKPKPPEGRDPRWLDALRDELAKSMVFASTGYQSETYFFAGALASFGQAAIPALVSAFEIALKSYPKKSLGYGVKPVLDAFDYLQSDAGVPLALAIVSRADKPEKSWAIPPVLEYLTTRTDKRIAPVIKKLYKKAAPKKPMHYIDDLEALAKQLDVA